MSTVQTVAGVLLVTILFALAGGYLFLMIFSDLGDTQGPTERGINE